MGSLVSVIVPVYKVEKYIHRCVDSILAQTFTNFELILVDDGSPDNCGKICDEYALKDNRIHVIHKENGGLSDARNAGIDWVFENSESEWLTFIDSDDWVHPKYLECLITKAEECNAQIVACNYKRIGEVGMFEKIDDIKSAIIQTEDFFVNQNTIATVACMKLYKRELFERIRFPLGKINEDEFVSYKLLFMNDCIIYIEFPLYYYFINPSSITNSEWNIKKLDALEALDNQYYFFYHSRYQKAFQCVVEKYIWFLRENYDCIQNYGNFNNKDDVIKIIRRNMRKCLWQKCIDKPIEKNERLYAIAYPHLINCYYLKKRIKKKIKRIVAR